MWQTLFSGEVSEFAKFTVVRICDAEYHSHYVKVWRRRMCNRFAGHFFFSFNPYPANVESMVSS